MATKLRLRPVRPDFVAEVEGIDLRQRPDAALAAAIHRAMDEYAVLVFRNQAINDDQQMAFGASLGTIEPTRATASMDEKQRLSHGQMNDISNLGADGRVLAADSRRRMFNVGNQLWHNDSSFKAVPAMYSMLHARVIPPKGGQTEVADMRAAWDALPDDEKAVVRDSVGEHSLLYSRALLGFTDFTEAERIRFTPVSQRLVRYHPGSGRRSLFLSSHIGRIRGMPVPEALSLLRDLMEHAMQREFVYRHEWQVNDLLMWDNRCTMHRGRPYDDKNQPRDMRRVTLQDVASSMEQAA
jgi:alpha-ketoglutarate-dependent 2,4-dichlorophenoxyacetate dioxygenase